jgi:hypothetical protein
MSPPFARRAKAMARRSVWCEEGDSWRWLTEYDGSVRQLQVMPGEHRLEAEFVALDLGPFNPRVQVSVTFRVMP